MALQLDHIIIAVDDLDSAMPHYRDLGFTTVYGGVHANRVTHNALIVFADGTYLELLAPTGEAPQPGAVDFGAVLQAGEGLAGFALGADDLESEAERLRPAGFGVGEIIPGERRRADGVLVQWKLALLDAGFAPFLIQDVTPRELRVSTDPALTTHANGVIGVRAVEIAVTDRTAAQARYGRLLSAAADVVILREASAEDETGLYAIHLVFESTSSGKSFPLEKTHGVRFVPGI